MIDFTYNNEFIEVAKRVDADAGVDVVKDKVTVGAGKVIKLHPVKRHIVAVRALENTN